MGRAGAGPLAGLEGPPAPSTDLCGAHTRPRLRPRRRPHCPEGNGGPSAAQGHQPDVAGGSGDSDAGGPTPDCLASGARPGSGEGPEERRSLRANSPAAASQLGAAAAGSEAATGGRGEGRTSWKDQHSRILGSGPGSAGVWSWAWSSPRWGSASSCYRRGLGPPLAASLQLWSGPGWTGRRLLGGD